MIEALSIRGLKKVYDNGFEALKGIDLTVKQGDFFALLGPNGAGKSTTIGVLCSLVVKSAGQVRIFGNDIDQDFSHAKKSLGVVPQEFNFNQFEKVADIVISQGGYYGLPRAIAVERMEKYLRKLGLWDKRHEAARNLSGGMKRRLLIARALVHEPQLLILDEPTAGVDIELRRSMWAFLQEMNQQGTTIILTTHYLEEAESLCRHVAIIDKGCIVQNTSIKSLLKCLDKEVFIFDTLNELSVAPVLENYPVTLVDKHCLEVELNKGQSLNSLFALFEQQSIDVVSMRNKINRLEELFVSLVEKNDSAEEKSR
ncbi:ABC transporter [Candidatus Endobugula sertula]|uniref:ABC transporter n=1 Tax=Candidatus Endobugula sertula TaxID=62101 RepID=A0A1D2QPN0_9GAMM|nr:ABC transporter [Candidatus Endobugula sertula]